MYRQIRIGGPIALIVIGLILALAVTNRLFKDIDLTMVGWILTGAGILWLVLSLISMSRSRVVTQTSSYGTGTPSSYGTGTPTGYSERTISQEDI